MYSRDPLRDGAAPAGADPHAPAAPRPAVAAGFGSPSHDFTVRRIDLNEALIRHPQASYVMRAEGEGMQGAGIDAGDTLLVDRAIAPAHGQVVIVVLGDEMRCRRLHRPHASAPVCLQAAHPDHADHVLAPGEALDVWGVVTHIIKPLLG